MNLAFSAIIAFLLLIPGLVFKRVLRSRGRFADIIPPVAPAFSTEAVTAVLSAGLVHLLTLSMLAVVRCWVEIPTLNLSALLMLLLVKFGDKEQHFDEVLAAVDGYSQWIVGYIFASLFVAVTLGFASGGLIDRFCRYFSILDARDQSVLEWKKFFRIGSNAYAMVTAVVEMGGVPYLFLGWLEKPLFNHSTSELDRLLLTDVSKRKLESTLTAYSSSIVVTTGSILAAEHEAPDEWEPVFGDQFTLRVSELKTLNVMVIEYARPISFRRRIRRLAVRFKVMRSVGYAMLMRFLWGESWRN